MKDKRIEAEAHLIGFYLVEEKKTDEIVREVRGGSITALGESRAMIEKGFLEAEEVSC